MRPASRSLARNTLQARRLHASTPLPPVQITTLPNKIRVATESTPGHFSSLGLYVDAGSRYETASTSGVSHFLDRLAFKTTGSRSDAEMLTAIDKLGGQIMCSSSRESIMYQSSHFHQATPQAMSLIAETASDPSFLADEIDAQREAARYEIREVNAKPEMMLPEILHDVAYDGQTLGNPLLCPEERIDSITSDLLTKTRAEWYRPERMVIAGSGMLHEELVELAEKHFSSIQYVPPPSIPLPLSRPAQNLAPPHLLPSGQPSVFTRAASYLYPTGSNSPDLQSPLSLDTSARVSYTGGHRFLQDSSSEFNHLYLAFEGMGIHDKDIYALATIQVLLGGGGSFSAGGPGKGMYSRLYTHILNHFAQIDHCASFNHIYTDSSLFGLFATFLPSTPHQQGNTAKDILPHLVHQLSLLLYTPITKNELNRAKNQLKSGLVMALESRSLEVEDLGRQLLVHDRKVPVSEMCDRIDEVTPESLREVAARVFGPNINKQATIVAMGHEDVGNWKSVLKKYGVGGH